MPDTNAQLNLNEWFEYWRLTDAAYVQLLRRWDLSLNGYFILDYLYSHPGGEEPAVLADTFSILRQSVTVVLNDLEGRGYIARRPDSVDRRRKKIVLTPAGRNFAGEVLPKIRAIELQCVADWDEEEQRLMVELTKRFYRKFTEATLRKS